jgi:hypothetical protein
MSLHEPVEQLLDQSLGFVGPIISAVHAVGAEHRVDSLRDMRDLARGSGHQLVYTRLLPDNHPGYSMEFHGTKYMHIKRGLSANSEIYTIAHELGHHEGYLGRNIALPEPQREFEANLFAVLLLTRVSPRTMQSILDENRDGRVAAGFFAIASGVVLAATLGSWLTRLVAPQCRERPTKE